MKMLNAIDDANLGDSNYAKAVTAETLGVLLRVLYPVVPHITWNLWAELGYAAIYGDLLDAAWPSVDETALVTDQLELVLQINGKLRGSLTVAREATKDVIEQLAAKHDAVVRNLEGRAPKRIIVVPGKLVNVVG
jgi:leucyl-tRNA synthetase